MRLIKGRGEAIRDKVKDAIPFLAPNFKRIEFINL